MTTSHVPVTMRHSIGIFTMALLVLAWTGGSAQSATREWVPVGLASG